MRTITLSGNAGVGAMSSCCRWINMGGWWAWVCGPGICRGGDAVAALRSGTARIVATSKTLPGMLGAKAPVQQLPLPVVNTGPAGDIAGNITGWLKENWYIPVGIFAAYMIFKK